MFIGTKKNIKMKKRILHFLFNTLFSLFPIFLYGQYQDRQQRKERLKSPIVCPATPYELVWQDEFSGTTLDTTYWRTSYGNPPPWDCTLPRGECGTELQVYRPENVVVNNGTLKLIAKKEKYIYQGTYGQAHPCAEKQIGDSFSLAFDYTSGVIETRAEAIAFKYGRFEINCRIPIGHGFWPAFWLWGGGGSTGRAGEIDILELFNTADSIYTTSVHNGRKKARKDFAVDWDVTDWHTYAVEWEPTAIKYYVDNQLIRVYQRFRKVDYDKHNGVFDVGTYRRNVAFPWEQWMVLRVNLALNPDVNLELVEEAAFPAIMEVKYVRVFKRKVVSSK